ncbi:MAG: alpha/beta hydrolase [Novosphingobium sp.]
MTDYVLVHGAWLGGWSYDRLAADLREAGHRVMVAQLAGLGSRSKELNPAIDLSVHVADVLALTKAAGFDRFVLAGHSYGGMIITGVATMLGARIDALVYIDAFLPGDGQSLWDITGQWDHDWYINGQKDAPGLIKPLPGLPDPRAGRHPLLTLLEPVHFTGEEAKVPRKIYIFASGWQPTPFNRFSDKVKGDPTWEYHALDATHDVMGTQPERLLAIMLTCAK